MYLSSKASIKKGGGGIKIIEHRGNYTSILPFSFGMLTLKILNWNDIFASPGSYIGLPMVLCVGVGW